jgi:hypothetical protein
VASNLISDSKHLRLQAVRQSEVPRGRGGKHKAVIDLLLRHLDQLEPGNALKVSLVALPCTKAQIRAALNRATHKRGLAIVTSSDAANLYLWKPSPNS